MADKPKILIQLDTDAQPPRQVYVADFTVEEGAIRPSSGLIAEGEQILRKRPRLLGGGGILGRRTASDFPSAGEVVNSLAASITDALNQEHLGFSAERIAPGTPLPSNGSSYDWPGSGWRSGSASPRSAWPARASAAT